MENKEFVFPSNNWTGVTIENSEVMKERADALMGEVHLLSVSDVRNYLYAGRKLRRENKGVPAQSPIITKVSRRRY